MVMDASSVHPFFVLLRIFIVLGSFVHLFFDRAFVGCFHVLFGRHFVVVLCAFALPTVSLLILKALLKDCVHVH